MTYGNKTMTAARCAALLSVLVAPCAEGADALPSNQATAPPARSVTEGPYVDLECSVSGGEFVAKNTTGLPTMPNTVVHFTNANGGDAFTFTAKSAIGGHGVVKAKPPHPAAACKAKFERGKTDLFSTAAGWQSPQSTTAQLSIFATNNFVTPRPFIVRFRASTGCKPSSDDVVIDSPPVDVRAGSYRIVGVQFPDTKRRMLTVEIDVTNVVPELDEPHNLLHSPEYYTACK